MTRSKPCATASKDNKRTDGAVDNPAVQHRPRWVVGLGLAAALIGAAGLTAVFLLPSDQELAFWLAEEAQQQLGVKLSIESAHWALLPTPVLVVNGLRTQQAEPVSIQQLRAYPGMRMLLERKLAFESVDIDTAVLPLQSVRAMEAALAIGVADGNTFVPLEHLTFRNLVWISYSGIALSFDGEVDFALHWRPQRAMLVRTGTTPAVTLALTREAQADRWQTRIQVGGGTAHGNLEMKAGENGTMHLSGQLAPREVEVASALESFNRRSPIAGKASGQTVLSAHGKSVGELMRSLHTQTRFIFNSATLLRFDLNQATSTGGKKHQGRTDLQSLTGRMESQNGLEGTRVTVTDMKAQTAKLTVTGKATVYHGHVEASGNLDLLAGTIGVPFSLSGPMDTPKVSVPPGFLAGAALGTAVLPGIGTVIGARIGGALDKIFHHNAEPAVPTKKSAIHH
ncbi:MAG: hypothetical protein IPG23_10450 [Burkholderiales bacterium]|nr:hypothetical protein [Burkholderiales bacterium]